MDVIDRGRAAHKRIQNRLADYLAANGWLGIQPNGEPLFDMAWEASGTPWIAEVKSLTATNETQQLRLGLGQILDYRSRVPKGTRVALVVEREPSDLRWIDICLANGVTLCWPADFEGLT